MPCPPEKDAIGVPGETQHSGFAGERKKERNRAKFSPIGGNGAGGVSSDEGTIGHVRIDFGHGGKEFYHTWWPRGPEERNTQEFREELGKVVDDLRKSVLKDLPSMRRYCYGGDGAIGGRSYCQNCGFTLETDRCLYRLQCNPIESDYQAFTAVKAAVIFYLTKTTDRFWRLWGDGLFLGPPPCSLGIWPRRRR